MDAFNQLRPRVGRTKKGKARTAPRLTVEHLESRDMLNATGVLAAGTLTITGETVPFERIGLFRDVAANQLVLTNFGQEAQRFNSAAVTSIVINPLGNNVQVFVNPNVLQTATINSSSGANAFVKNLLVAGGGVSTLLAANGVNRLAGGSNVTTVIANQGVNSVVTSQFNNSTIVNGGFNRYYGFKDKSTILPAFNPLMDLDYRCLTAPPDLSQTLGLQPSPQVTLNTTEVNQLLSRASAATPSEDGIIVIVDRSGRILGVRTEAGVDPAILADPALLSFAVDGAVAKARTAAFFGNNQAPLTSRTVQFISQTTMTQREVESNPSSADPFVQGPGFVAPVGIKNHFPPEVPFTPQVDLFAIEHTNRDTTFHLNDGNPRVQLSERFNVNPAQIPIPVDQRIAPPDSYGYASGLAPNQLPRGIATLPGGIPIYKQDPVTGQFVVVGGIGVFYPGKTGYATEENSSLSSTFNPALPDRTLEAEFVAFAALGGAPLLDPIYAVGTLGGIAPLPNIVIPITPEARRIDLVGISLDIIGPQGLQGPELLLQYATNNLAPGTGVVSGVLQPLLNPGANNKIEPGDPLDADSLLNGTIVPEGFLVTPHASKFAGGLSADDVLQMIQQGVAQAIQTRAAIRLPLDQHVVMVFAVADLDGEILGLFRMPDSTVFSIDVAVAKSRNVNYYANADKLQPIDQVPGVPAGTAFTNRTFRYLSLPRFPEGIDGMPPGPFSIYNDGGINPVSATNFGPPLPVSAYQSVQGFDAFNPQTNFRDPTVVPAFGPVAAIGPFNENGIVFFPGAVPLYKNGVLVGGVGISGDGVDQDDVVTFETKQGFDTPANVLRADQVFVRGVRLPYQKFNRQPTNF